MGTSSPISNRNDKAPDGGWGWVIVVAGFINYFILGFVFSSFVMLYIALVEYFQSGRGKIGGIGSMFSFTGNFLGIPTGLLVKKYGSRRICIIGCIMLSLSHLLSSLLINIPYLYFTHGVIGGIANGLIFLPTTVIVQQYFDTKLPLAIGISMSGLSIGSTLSAPLINALLELYGLAGCYVMMAALCLHTVVATSLFRPVHQYVMTNRKGDKLQNAASKKTTIGGRDGSFLKKDNQQSESRTLCHEQDCERCVNDEPLDNRMNRDRHEIVNQDHHGQNCCPSVEQRRQPGEQEVEAKCSVRIPSEERCAATNGGCDTEIRYERPAHSKQVCAEYLGIELLKKREFVVYLLAAFPTSFGTSSLLSHFTSRSIYIGLDRRLAVIVQVSMDACTVLGRYVFSAIAKAKRPNNTIQCAATLTSISVAVVMLPSAKTFHCVLFTGMLLGFLVGGLFTLQLIVLAHLTGNEQSEVSVGYFIMIIAVGSLIGIPVTGFVYDISESYDIPLYVVGVSDAIGATLIFVAAFLANKHSNNRSVNNTSD